MINNLEQLMTGLNAALFSAISFFAGLWIGHRLTLGLDKRREFNQAADPVREWLLKTIERPSADWPPPSLLQMDTFRQSLGPIDRARFAHAWKTQQEQRQTCQRRDVAGGFYLVDVSHYTAALQRCLKLTARR